jgi:two-component system OmpR family response regulator
MASDQIKVLVVDDELNIRDLLTTSLKFNGYAVYAVGNGNDAVVAAEKGKPDIILLDVMLPDMSGFAVTKKLRSMNISNGPRRNLRQGHRLDCGWR